MRNWIKAAPRPRGLMAIYSAFRTLCIKLYLTSRKGGERGLSERGYRTCGGLARRKRERHPTRRSWF